MNDEQILAQNSAPTSFTEEHNRFFSKEFFVDFYHEPFHDLARSPDLWKLIIDARYHVMGKNFFNTSRQLHEGEPGYVECACSAFKSVLIPSLGYRLSVGMIVDLHDALVDGLKKKMVSDGKEIFVQHLKGIIPDEKRHFAVAFGLSVNPESEDRSLTEDGAKEIYVHVSEENVEYYPYRLASLPESDDLAGEPLEIKDASAYQHELGLYNEGLKGLWMCRYNSNKTYVECINLHIETYYDDIEKAKEDNMKKLQAICKFLATIERIHPFYDGNCRTVYFLLQKLLADNCFPLTVLDNPNIFDGFSVAELVEKVVLGMDKFAACFPDITFSYLTVPRECLNNGSSLMDPHKFN
jgi:hypothetical protein